MWTAQDCQIGRWCYANVFTYTLIHFVFRSMHFFEMYIYLYIFIYLKILHWTSQPREKLGWHCLIHQRFGQQTVRSVMLSALWHTSPLYVWNHDTTWLNKIIPHGLRWIPLNHQNQWRNRRWNEAHKMLTFQDFRSQNQTLHNCTVFRQYSKNKFSEFNNNKYSLISAYRLPII